MFKGSRLRNQQKSAEQKRALLERMRAAQEAKKSAPRSSEQAAPVEVQPMAKAGSPEPTELAPQVRYGSVNLRLYQDSSEIPLVAAQPLARLVDLYIEAACGGSAHQALLWPAAPQVLPLVHVLATAEFWTTGKKQGLRGLYFPAKENTFYPLNHVSLDRQDLMRCAQEMVHIPSVPDKDPVLFKAANTADTRPTINDLFPHFAMQEAGDAWQSYEGKLLEHTLKKVSRYSEKAALRSSCAILGAPRSAPDAIFAFGYRAGREDLRECFRNLNLVGQPNVCLVNATRAVRLTIPDWHRLVGQFIRAYLESYPTERPGLVLVTDDPGVGFRLRDIADKETQRAVRRNPNTLPLRMRFDPILCQTNGALGQCLKPQGAPEPPAPLPRRYRVEVRDADAGRVVRMLHQIRSELALSPDEGAPFSQAATFLHRLAALPAGMKDIEAWLDERQAEAPLRRKLSWLTPRADLVQFLTTGRVQGLRDRIEAVIRLADRLVENYSDATTMALAMAAEVAEARGSTRVVLVFTRPMHLLLAERFLARQSFQGNRSLDTLRPNLRLILSKHLLSEARDDWATRYVLVGVDDDALRILMTEDGIPADSVLLLTQRTGLYVRWSLKPIYEQAEFKRFKPRLEHILRQLDGMTGDQEAPLLHFDDFVLPSFDFTAPSAGRDDDPEAWRIVLDGIEPIFRSATSTVYVYDPLADLRSKSGFSPREVRSLQPGQQLFVMSDSLRDRVEYVLQRAGVPIEHDKPFEQTLRQYHETVTRKLAERFGSNLTLTAQVAALRSAILQNNPQLESELGNLRHWVNLGRAPDTPFDQVRPQAPRHFKVFAAFTSALGLADTDATYFWSFAIHPIRVNRRLDGRYISDVYTRILFDPESAVVHGGLSPTDIASLFSETRRNVHTVVAIEPPAPAGVSTVGGIQVSGNHREREANVQ